MSTIDKKYLLSILVCFIYFSVLKSQNISGYVYDAKTHEPLAFTNLGILGKPYGGVSNTDGEYILNLNGFHKNDTLVCSYIGYNPQRFAVGDLDSTLNINLELSTQSLQGITVFATPYTPLEIIEKMVENKTKNYNLGNYKARIFRREQAEFEKESFNLKLKNSTIDIFNPSLINKLNSEMPDSTMYFVDLLFDLYHYGAGYKLHDIKRIAQVDESLDELSHIGYNIINHLDSIKNKKDETYWKARSGLFLSKKLNNDKTPSLPNDSSSLKDSTVRVAVWHAGDGLCWEQDFITKPNKYHYELEGGIDIDNEAAYIIHFTPNGGKLEGRMYVSTKTFALLRVTYALATNEKGKGFSLMGVTFRNKEHEATVYYQRYKDGYCLKYCMEKTKDYIKVKRPLSLIEKQKRFLFDKTLNEANFEIDLGTYQTQTTEYLISNIEDIGLKEYNQSPKIIRVRTEHVKEYNDPSIWKGYSVLGPTQSMKSYRMTGN